MSNQRSAIVPLLLLLGYETFGTSNRPIDLSFDQKANGDRPSV